MIRVRDVPLPPHFFGFVFSRHVADAVTPKQKPKKGFTSQFVLTHYYFAQRYATLQNTKNSFFFVSICANVENKGRSRVSG